jgi:hypothetical protein
MFLNQIIYEQTMFEFLVGMIVMGMFFTDEYHRGIVQFLFVGRRFGILRVADVLGLLPVGQSLVSVPVFLFRSAAHVVSGSYRVGLGLKYLER